MDKLKNKNKIRMKIKIKKNGKINANKNEKLNQTFPSTNNWGIFRFASFCMTFLNDRFNNTPGPIFFETN